MGPTGRVVPVTSDCIAAERGGRISGNQQGRGAVIFLQDSATAMAGYRNEEIGGPPLGAWTNPCSQGLVREFAKWMESSKTVLKHKASFNIIEYNRKAIETVHGPSSIMAVVCGK